MRNKRLMTMGLAALLVVTGLMAMVPSAHAQAPTQTQPSNLQIKIDAFSGPIMPLKDSSVTSLSGKYSYAAGGWSLTPTQIEFKVANAPPWAVVTLSPTSILVPVQASPDTGASGSIETVLDKVEVIVSTTAEAPAFQDGVIEIQATAKVNNNIQQQTATATVPVKANFFSIVDGVPQTTIQLARPQQQVAYPVTVQNLGNGPTKLFFEVTEKPEGWQVVPPPPVTLESKATGGKNTQQSVNLMIQTPFRNGYLNEVGAATMVITSAYSLDTNTKGDSTQLTTLTTTRGFYVPGLVPLQIFAALGVVALVLRRRLA